MHHNLKLMEKYWGPKLDGRKPWEYRSTTDRDFKVGDTVTFGKVSNDAIANNLDEIYGPVTITYIFNIPSEKSCIFTHT